MKLTPSEFERLVILYDALPIAAIRDRKADEVSVFAGSSHEKRIFRRLVKMGYASEQKSTKTEFGEFQITPDGKLRLLDPLSLLVEDVHSY